MTQIALHLSTLRLTIDFPPDAATIARTLRAVWRGAERVSFVTAKSSMCYSVEATSEGYSVSTSGGDLRQVAEAEDVVPCLESFLYRDFIESHRQAGLAVLHASGVVLQQRKAILFLGVSGSGKSALARSALAAGLTYFGDEHVISDGNQVWGLPRAIHMDPHLEEQPPLVWHAGADVSSYRFRTQRGRRFLLPLVPVGENQLQQTPISVQDTTIVALQHGAVDAIATLSAAQRLTVVERCHFVRSAALLPVALAGSAFALTWRDPAVALALLLEKLGAA